MVTGICLQMAQHRPKSDLAALLMLSSCASFKSALNQIHFSATCSLLYPTLNRVYTGVAAPVNYLQKLCGQPGTDLEKSTYA